MAGYASAAAWPHGDYTPARTNQRPRMPARTAPARHAEARAAPAYAPHFADYRGHVAAFEQSPELARLIAGMVPDARAQFTSAHLAALEVAIARTRPSPDRHKTDFRVSLPFFGRRYYLRFLGGIEQRNDGRLQREGQSCPRRQSLAYTVLLSVLVSSGLVAGVVILYFLKSVLGVDLFQDHSIIHNLIF